MKKINFFGPNQADVTIVGWGSTKGPILDGMQDLEADGIRCNFLQVRYMNPFPTELVTKHLQNARKKILIENNYSGQLGALIREHTGIAMDYKILKYNGRPFSQNEVYEGVKDALKNGDEGSSDGTCLNSRTTGRKSTTIGAQVAAISAYSTQYRWPYSNSNWNQTKWQFSQA